MKAAPFLLLTLGAASAFACADYSYCHCYDSNGVPDDKATESVCINWYNDDIGISSDCVPSLGGINNCDFAKLCAVAFATGGDSSCSQKCGWLGC
jgi:hypothetical protein